MIPPKKPALRLAHSSPTVERTPACAPTDVVSMRPAVLGWLQRQAYQDTDLLAAITLRVQLGKRQGIYPDDMTVGDWASWALQRTLCAGSRSVPVEVDAPMVGEIEDHLTETATRQTWQEFLTAAAWKLLRSRQGN